MNEKDTVRTSKFLSLVLRHKPQEIGLALDQNGWASVAELLQKCNAAGNLIDFEMLQHIVETNPKKRFAFNDGHTKIRANQGHSVDIDLNLKQQAPPEILFHGTAIANLASIRESGLDKQLRHHVHLSDDKDTAHKVGSRHGKPVVLEILALKMHEKGHLFFKSENGVWLVDHVEPEFIK